MGHPRTIFSAFALSMAMLAASAHAADGAVQEISTGQKVDIAKHLAPGKYTVVEFGAPW